MSEATPKEVVSFWIDEVGPEGWYAVSEDLDRRIRERFLPLWESALAGELNSWCAQPEDCFGLLILTDQFPRNMFRGDDRSFATDPLARRVAKRTIDRRWDLRFPEPGRQFFYMPLMHSENLSDQDRCIRLVADRLPDLRDTTLLHARAHREIIRRFGRFPFRNEALGRMTLPDEAAFMDAGGYGALVRELGG